VTPYMQQWHLSTQYQLPGETVLEIGYAGSKGTKQYLFFNANQAAATTDPNADFASRRPIPAIDGSIADIESSGLSSYNSLQVRAEKRFSHGLTFLAAWTWAHSIDLASSADLGAQNGGDFRDHLNPQWERADSDFDIRNRFVFSYLYELPFGRGKRFLGDAGKVVEQIAGGWQFGGITTISQGNSFTITDGNGDFSNSDGQQRPDLIGDPHGTPCLA
jgi:hypothetical protein